MTALSQHQAEIVVLGATPAGIAAALAAGRRGRDVLLLDRGQHVGGLPANGLGATDLITRGAVGGVFREFVGRVEKHYRTTYGPDSPQHRACAGGYRFEPHVAEQQFEQMLAACDRLQVLRGRQFDPVAKSVDSDAGRVRRIRVKDRAEDRVEWIAGEVFVDATYEGDLAAAAGAPFRVGRESADQLGEPCAGRVYKIWDGPVVPTPETGEGDETIQAYNYRVCITDRANNRVAVEQPASYDRDEYAPLVEAVRGGVLRSLVGDKVSIFCAVELPNDKYDANNHHEMLLSSDLPEENWAWPSADWQWRDRFAARLRDYTLGLIWFCQNDPALPQWFRDECGRFGLAADEYADNGHFPRQVYVREARRIEGRHDYTAHDVLPVRTSLRPPIHADSVTANHYDIDSHACRKFEPGRAHLDGFLSIHTTPYTVPLGVMLCDRTPNVITPVAMSASHLGFGTLRMEPCWMALGQAAGAAATMAVEAGASVLDPDVAALQRRLLGEGAVLIYLNDVAPGDEHYEAIQMLALRGLLQGYWLRPEEPVDETDAARWAAKLGLDAPPTPAPGQTRGQYLQQLYDTLQG